MYSWATVIFQLKNIVIGDDYIWGYKGNFLVWLLNYSSTHSNYVNSPDSYQPYRKTQGTVASFSKKKLSIYPSQQKDEAKKNSQKWHMKENGQMSLSSFVAEPRKLCYSVTSSTFHQLDHSSLYSICPHRPFPAAKHCLSSHHNEEPRPKMFILSLSVLVSFSTQVYAVLFFQK